MEPHEVRVLYEAMNVAGFSELDLRLGKQGRVRLLIDRRRSESGGRHVGSESSPTPAPPITNRGSSAQTITITSERVGVFSFSRNCPSPGARVELGQPLGIISGINIQDQLVAPCAGTIAAVFAEAEQIVEFGQPLFALMPDTP